MAVMHGRRLEHTAAFGGGGARGLRRLRCGGCAAAAAQASSLQASGGVSMGERGRGGVERAAARCSSGGVKRRRRIEMEETRAK